MNNVSALTPAGNYDIQATQTVTDEMLQSFNDFLHGSSNTRVTYGRAIKQFFKYLYDNGIVQPTRKDLNDYRKYIEKHVDPETGKTITHKPATIQLYIQAVKLFFQWTESERLYPNIAEHLQGAKIDREHKKDYFTDGQIKNILNGIDRSTETGLRDYTIIALVTACGLRDIEVVRANIEDIGTAGGNPVLWVQGKGHDEKAVPVKLPEQVETILRRYLKARGHVAQEDPLFTAVGNRNKGGRMTTKSISRLIKSHMVNAGYDNARWTAHSLRHTAVTLALLNGNSLDEVQQFARHANIATTMIYNHAIQRENNKCSQAVADAIF